MPIKTAEEVERDELRARVESLEREVEAFKVFFASIGSALRAIDKSEWSVGEIENVRWYNRALSKGEIRKIFTPTSQCPPESASPNALTTSTS